MKTKTMLSVGSGCFAILFFILLAMSYYLSKEFYITDSKVYQKIEIDYADLINLLNALAKNYSYFLNHGREYTKWLDDNKHIFIKYDDIDYGVESLNNIHLENIKFSHFKEYSIYFLDNQPPINIALIKKGDAVLKNGEKIKTYYYYKDILDNSNNLRRIFLIIPQKFIANSHYDCTTPPNPTTLTPAPQSHTSQPEH